MELIYVEISRNCSKTEFLKSLKGLIFNGIANQFSFFKAFQDLENLNDKQVNELLLNIFMHKNSAELYLKKNNFWIKIIIRIEDNGNILEVIPLESYKINKNLNSDKNLLDIEFYIKSTLELCENFSIYEFYTKNLS